MASRDILVLNTTASRAETQQGSDTVIIKNISNEAFRLENSSGTSVLSVNTSGSSGKVTLTGNITASGNVSSSLSSTASFGRLEATTLIGSAFNLTNTALTNTISASSQIANRISGSFRSGFAFNGKISGSAKSTGSFGRIESTTIVGDVSRLTRTDLDGTISSSAQLESRISGAFQSGFGFDGTIKKGLGTWTATNPINTARQQVTAFGSQNATVLAGGNVAPRNESETWNGTNWSEGNNLNTGRYGLASAGTATAGLVFGGNPAVADTETYDGTDYSEVNNMIQGRYGVGGWGTQNSAIAVGGAVSEYNNICALTEEWNGTNWSEVNDLNNARWYMGTAGDSSESGIVFGGSYASPAFAVGIATTEQWNGTSWSEVNDLNVNLLYTRGQGSTNNAIAAGGLINSPTNTFSTCTETWDGTSWSVEAALNVAGRYLGIGGNGDGAIAAGFSVEASPYAATNSELFQAIFVTASFGRLDALSFHGDGTNLTNTVKTGTLSSSAQIADRISGSFTSGFEFSGTISGSSTSTGSFGRIESTTIVGSAANLTSTTLAGTVSSSAQIAGRISGSFNKGFDFDGTISNTPLTFTAGGAMINMGAPAALYVYHRGGAGNKNAGLFFGGYKTAGATTTATTEEYDGTSFSEVNDMNNAGSGGGSGTSEAALMTGGYSRGCDTEEYNGTNWSQVNDMNIDTWCYSPIVFGASSEAAVASSGGDSPYTQTETWNGTNWSTANQMINDARFWIGGTGTSNAGITVGGVFSPSPQNTKTELWNGTNWSAGPNTTIDNMKLTGLVGSQNDALTGGHLQRSTFDGNLFSNYPNASGRCSIRYDGSSWSAAGDLGMGCSDMNMMALTGIGQSVGVGMFGGGLSPHSPHYHNNTFEVTDASVVTASFGRVEVNKLSGDGSQLTNTIPLGSISGSGMIAEQISGSFTKGFNFTGNISGSIISTGSFDKVIVSGKISGDGSNLTGLTGGMISSSAQIESRISGAFQSGFEFDGTVQTTPAAWSLGVAYPFEQGNIQGVAVGQSPNAMLAHYGTGGDVFNGSSWSEITAAPAGTNAGVATGDYDAALFIGGNRSGSQSWNGSSWTAEGSTNRANTYLASGAGTTEAALVFGGGSGSNDSIGHVSNQTELYDGSSWSEVNDMLIPKYKGSQTGIGSSNSTIAYGGCGKAQTYSPPSPMSSFTISDPRQEGTHLEEWDGSTWTYKGDFYAHPGPSFFNHSGAGVGTTNAASFYGGYTHHFGGSGLNSTHYHWDGTAMSNGVSMLIPKSNNDGAGQGGVTGAHSSIFAWYSGYGGSHPTYGAAAIGGHEQYEVFYSTGSFGYVYAESYKGDGSGLTNTSKTGTVSGSGGIASRISGSFQSGFVFNGSLSGSASSTGSFAHVTANTLTGNISNLSNVSLPANSLSSSAQLAGVVSASFEQGEYTFEGNLKPTLGAWSSVNGLNTARASTMGFGNNNAAIAAGGCTANGDYNAWTEKTEQWNGTNWTEVNDMIRHGSRNGRGAGTQDAGLAFGGFQSGYCTEEWNGTIWDTVASMNVERDGLNGYGTQNAAMAVSGYYPNSNSRKDSVETYDGFAWTNTQTMIQTRYGFTGAGSVNASIVSVGRTTYAHGPYGRACNMTELWDGTTWSEVGPNNTSGEFKLGAGTVNAFTMFSGDEGIYQFTSPYNYSDYMTPNSNDKRDYDGIAFSEQARLINSGISGRGFNSPNSQTSVMAIGGSTPAGMQTSTEIYTHCQASASFGRIETPKTQITNNSRVVAKESFQLPIFGTNPVTSSAGEVWYNRAEEKLYFTYDVNTWTTIANTITARQYAAGAGSSAYDGLVAGGGFPSYLLKTEHWNGSAWSECNDHTDQGHRIGGGWSSCDMLLNAGYVNQNKTETWDGTNWTETGAADSGGGYSFAGMGTSNAFIKGGGFNNGHVLQTGTAEWGGTAWYSSEALPTAVGAASAAGTQNSALFFGGRTPGTVPDKCTFAYNGTSWSTENVLNQVKEGGGRAGTQNAALSFGGYTPTELASTEEWNGINWKSVNDMNTARRPFDSSMGTQASAFAATGGDGNSSDSEIYTATSVKAMCIGGV